MIDRKPVYRIENVSLFPESSEDKRRATRVHFFPKGESIAENLFTRHFRPYHVWREFLPVILAQISSLPGFKGINVETAKPHWSQKAGCSCGCSPAFILRGWSSYRDISVDIVDETPPILSVPPFTYCAVS